MKYAVLSLSFSMVLAGCATTPVDRGNVAALPAEQPQQCTATATDFEPPTPAGIILATDQPMRMIAASCWADRQTVLTASRGTSVRRGTLVALYLPSSD